MLLGVAGTIISMVCLSLFILWFNNISYDEDDINKLKPVEWLLLASVLCATDSVAALAIVKESVFPTLNSIMFGEGVVNDAVSILIYQAVAQMIESSSEGNDDNTDLPITAGLIGKNCLGFSIYFSA